MKPARKLRPSGIRRRHGAMDDTTIQQEAAQRRPGRGQASPRLSAEQRETLNRGLRLLARGIARAHLRSAAIPAPRAQHSSGARAAVPHREAEAGE